MVKKDTKKIILWSVALVGIMSLIAFILTLSNFSIPTSNNQTTNQTAQEEVTETEVLPIGWIILVLILIAGAGIFGVRMLRKNSLHFHNEWTEDDLIEFARNKAKQRGYSFEDYIGSVAYTIPYHFGDEKFKPRIIITLSLKRKNAEEFSIPHSKDFLITQDLSKVNPKQKSQFFETGMMQEEAINHVTMVQKGIIGTNPEPVKQKETKISDSQVYAMKAKLQQDDLDRVGVRPR